MYVSDTWKGGSLSFLFTHPPEDQKKKEKKEERKSRHHLHIRRRRGHGFESHYSCSSVSFIESLVRASLKTCLTGSPGTEPNRIGPRAAAYGTATYV